MNQIESLLKKIEDKTYTIGIVSLGYVGLPLMWTFHQNGMPVFGYDIDANKVEYLNNGIPYIKHLGTEMMEILANSDKADATIDFSRLDEAYAILLCVPAPLDHQRELDMSYMEQATETVSKYLREGQLVIRVSTNWPGTTEELMILILERNSGLKVKGAEIAYYDSYNPEIWETREHAEYIGMQTVDWNKETVFGFDAVLIPTNHSTIDYAELAEWSECIVDIRNVFVAIDVTLGKKIFRA